MNVSALSCVVVAAAALGGPACAFFPADASDAGEGEGEGEDEGEGDGCPPALPPGWGCVDDVLVCLSPTVDGFCRTDEDTAACVNGPVCLTACGGDQVSPECVEAEPGGPRSARCPIDSVADTTCECASRCDCEPGEVCVENRCGPPPERCLSADECPRGPIGDVDLCAYFACNGFTDTCFAPQPTVCAVDDDCAFACLTPPCVCLGGACEP